MTAPKRPPRDNLYRAVVPGLEYRAESEDNRPRLEGHFARFGEWNRIDSFFEGTFLERIDHGAFKRTLKNKGTQMPVLFQHGQDPEIGDKVIAATEELREDETGPFFRARVLEGLPELVMSGLRENRYGVSYRFRVLKEDFQGKPGKSKHNPEGIPERTIQEAEVFEYGPVTFPADPGASVAVRSLTDAYLGPDLIRNLISDPEQARRLIEVRPDLVRNDPALASAIEDALPDDGPDESHSDEGTRAAEPPEAPPVEPPAEVPATTTQDPPAGGSLSVRENQTVNTIEEVRARLDEIKARFAELDAEIGINRKTDEQETEWNALLEERTDLQARVDDYESRKAVVQAVAQKPGNVERAVPNFTNSSTRKVPENIWALDEYRNRVGSAEELKQAYTDGAKRANEIVTLGHPKGDKAHVERLLETDGTGEFAHRVIATSSAEYMRAFGKLLVRRGNLAMLSPSEQRAIATVGSTQLADGGYAVPYQLDPSIILTSAGSVNPLRSMARVETLTSGNTWKGVTSAGISVSRVSEETAVTPTSPSLAQPSVTVQAVKAEIQFSIESDGDWPRLQAEMARLLQDAKDSEEATQFITGNGNGTTGNPEGVVAGLAASSHVGTKGDGLSVDDLFRLQGELPDRFEPNAQFLAHRAVYNAIRQFGTGSTVGEGAVWQNSLQPGQPGQLIGYPARTASGMEDDYTTTGNLILLFGDFSNGYIIVDKAGMSIEIDPHVRDGNGAWTGQRALLAVYRNNAMVLVDNALRCLKVGVITS